MFRWTYICHIIISPLLTIPHSDTTYSAVLPLHIEHKEVRCDARRQVADALSGNVRACASWFWVVLILRVKRANAQIHHNNDWFDKGSYSHQRPGNSKGGRTLPHELPERTNPGILPGNSQHLHQQINAHAHSPVSRYHPNGQPQIQSTHYASQSENNYLWDVLSQQSRSTIKDLVLNIMIDS